MTVRAGFASMAEGFDVTRSSRIQHRFVALSLYTFTREPGKEWFLRHDESTHPGVERFRRRDF